MSQNKIIFFSETLTERLKYTAHLVFTEHLGLDIFFTTDETYFAKTTLPKIAYTGVSTSAIPAFFIKKTSNILFEKHILNTAFETIFDQADVLGKIFFLTTRYEEYSAEPSVFDRHNRFPASASTSHKLNILRQPVVNQWIIQIKNQLREIYTDLLFEHSTFHFLPTYDVDQAWAIKNKGFLRNSGSLLSEILRGQFGRVFNRFLILTTLKKDPEYTFDFLNDLDKKYNLKPIYFWLLADHATFDKNINWQNRAFQNLIRRLAKTHLVGLHPSYASNNDLDILKKEKDRFESITKHPHPSGRCKLSISRQHYLKLRFPDTYNRLIQVGIDADYSMGYADDVGFRAGICTPFYWFDLARNQATNLKIHPFAIMEITLKEYLKLSPEESLVLMKKMVAEVKNVGGTFTTLWHNSTLSDNEEWGAWQQVYINFIEHVKQLSLNP